MTSMDMPLMEAKNRRASITKKPKTKYDKIKDPRERLK